MKLSKLEIINIIKKNLNKLEGLAEGIDNQSEHTRRQIELLRLIYEIRTQLNKCKDE